MIDFRYHLVSIVAIFLALTVGIVLGSTMLQDPLLHTLKAETSQLREQSEQLRVDKDLADRLNAGNGQLVGAYEEVMLNQQLDGLRVAVVEPPGVDDETRDALLAQVRRAGGTVSGRLALTDAYLDPGGSSRVDEVTDRWGQELDLPEGNPYERAGTVIAQAVVATAEEEADAQERDTGTAFDPEAALDAYGQADLLTLRGDPASSADVVLVLAPAEPFALADGQDANDTATTPPANAAVLALARAFEQAGGGTVLAGPPTSDEATGIVRQARAEEARFSTVDTVGTAAGDIVTVLVLALTSAGEDGHYGIGAQADGFLPSALPTPEAAPTSSPSPDDDS